MSKQRGRPKTSPYDTAFLVRMTKHDLARFKLDFDRHCITLGQWDKRGNRRSMNDYLLKRMIRVRI